jgi:hypothetical protein
MPLLNLIKNTFDLKFTKKNCFVYKLKIQNDSWKNQHVVEEIFLHQNSQNFIYYFSVVILTNSINTFGTKRNL